MQKVYESCLVEQAPVTQVRRSIFTRSSNRDKQKQMLEEQEEGAISYKNLNKTIKEELNVILS